jgi:hypothetical protein
MMGQEGQGGHKTRPCENKSTVGTTLVVALARTANGLETVCTLRALS